MYSCTAVICTWFGEYLFVTVNTRHQVKIDISHVSTEHVCVRVYTSVIISTSGPLRKNRQPFAMTIGVRCFLQVMSTEEMIETLNMYQKVKL